MEIKAVPDRTTNHAVILNGVKDLRLPFGSFRLSGHSTAMIAHNRRIRASRLH
jgi:hypothetical protein